MNFCAEKALADDGDSLYTSNRTRAVLQFVRNSVSHWAVDNFHSTSDLGNNGIGNYSCSLQDHLPVFLDIVVSHGHCQQ